MYPTFTASDINVWKLWNKSCKRGSDPDLVFDDEFLKNVTNLEAKFDDLNCEEQEAESSFDSSLLNCDITLEEVSAAIDSAKLGKAFLSCLVLPLL